MCAYKYIEKHARIYIYIHIYTYIYIYTGAHFSTPSKNEEAHDPSTEAARFMARLPTTIPTNVLRNPHTPSLLPKE